jgi:NADPH2:quinone reductase
MNELSKTMKAVVVRENGPVSSPQALHFESDYPTPILIQGHAIVKNLYSGINFIDTYHRQGLYPRNLPFICGQEGGGTIVSIMPNDNDNDNATGDEQPEQQFQIGDRVVYSSLETYAEFTLVPIKNLIAVPQDIDMKIALACMVQGLTAHYLITSAHANLIQKEEWCLIYSVGSGTCQWAAQMAKIQGYKVIGTTSRNKLEQAKGANCDELIVLEEAAATATGKGYADYTSVDIVQKVMGITNGEGVKMIVDGVGKSTAEISLNCLARRGIFVSFGNASGAVEPFPLLRLSKKSAFVTRPKLLDYVSTREELLGRINEVFDWVRSGELKIGIDKEFSLEEAADAHHFIESGQTKGKLLLTI